MMHDKIRVLLADDHPLVRVGIRTILEHTNDLKVIGEAKHGAEILPLCAKFVPDILLLDLSMPDSDPIVTVNAVQAGLPQIKIIILSAYNISSYVSDISEVNIDGYVLKEDAPEDLVQAIRAVMGGKIWYSQAVVQQILAMKRSEPYSGEALLTRRERQILALVAKGWGNTQIAAELNLAEQTVKNYLSSIYRNLNVSTRAEAIIWAINHG